MSKAGFDKPVQIKTTPWAKQALDRFVAKLQASGRVRFNDKPLTREALFGLVWFWLDEIDLAMIEAGLERQIPKLEAALEGIDPYTIPTPPPDLRGIARRTKVRKVDGTGKAKKGRKSDGKTG